MFLALSTDAAANEGGRVGYSGKDGPICNACHGGGSRPMVRFEGPLEVAAGTVVTFRFVVQSHAAVQDEAGFNVAGSAGVLGIVLGQGTRLSAGELTHSSPRHIDALGESSWMFTWHAPATLGEHQLFGAGNSVNGNGNTDGDRAAAVVLDVLVVAPVSPSPTPTASATATSSSSPTATPTVTPNADTQTPTAIATATSSIAPSLTSTPAVPPSATVTATNAPSTTATPSTTSTPTACSGDCDGNGRVTIDELISGVNIALGLAALDRCPAFDADGDGGVSVAELVAAVRTSLRGC